MLTLPPPKFHVEGFEGNRGAHLYRVKALTGEVLEGYLPSVTKKLDLIGGSKTGALMGWAVKEALSHVEKRMVLALSSNEAVTRELVVETLAAGRKRPERVKDAAADLGTRVHGLIDEWILTGSTRAQDVDEMVAFCNFTMFVSKYKMRFLSGDLPVASLRYKYGGRLDAIAEINGKLVLLDWKTSNAIRDDYALQVAAYRLALFETYGIRADKAMVVRFDKVDPKVLDHKEVRLAQATKTWKALAAFEGEYNKEVWK
jgi:hypothetical protein